MKPVGFTPPVQSAIGSLVKINVRGEALRPDGCIAFLRVISAWIAGKLTFSHDDYEPGRVWRPKSSKSTHSKTTVRIPSTNTRSSEMPAHGLCEDATLYLPSDPDHIVHAIAVGNMGDI
jgi:hypothetical protein